MEWTWDLISYSLIHKQSHFSLSLSFCERRSSKYVHFLMTAGFSSATDTGPRASWWLFAHIPLLNVHPEPWICYFDISYKRIFYPPPSLPSSQAITAKDGEIICVWSIIGWLSLWKHVWDCFRMRGYDAQIFPGFLHSGFGGPDTSQYVWVLQATAVLFGCLFLWHSHSVLFSNTDFHAYVHVWQHCKPSHFFRANEPWWLGLTVLWVWSWISAR